MNVLSQMKFITFNVNLVKYFGFSNIIRKDATFCEENFDPVQPYSRGTMWPTHKMQSS